MIRETVTVTAVETDCLWVEGAAKTTCGSCSARQGCGQRLLGKLMARPNVVRVPLRGGNSADYQVGKEVEIGVAEQTLVNAALLIYLLPLAGLLLGCGLAQSVPLGEWGTVCFGIAGLLIGAVGVRIHAWRRRNSDEYSPVLLK